MFSRIFKFSRPKAAKNSSSTNLGATFDQALSLNQQGQVVQAIAICHEILELQPDHCGALILLAEIAVRREDSEQAIQLYAKVIGLKPDYAPAHYKRGNLFKNCGQLEAALASYDRAVALDPNYANAFCNRGVVLEQLNRLDVALASYDQAIALNSYDALAYYNRGTILREFKQFELALASYNQAIAVEPNYAEAYCNRGILLQELKQPELALASYNQSIAINPNLFQAYFNRGTLLEETKQWNEALASYDQAIEIDQDNAEAYCNRGVVLVALKRWDIAFASFDRAIALKPDFAEVYTNRANALMHWAQFQAAIASYDKAILFKPDFPFLLGMRRHAKMHICDWNDLQSDIDRLSIGVEADEAVSPPFQILALMDSAALQRKAAEKWAETQYPQNFALTAISRYRNHDRIRIGYFSADFHAHATAYLIAGLFEMHDRVRFDVTAFSFGPDSNDTMRTRLRGACKFIDVADQSDLLVATLAREREIDIAIDLKGFTQHNRAGIFALRAAPLQVSFLGYPGTMGTAYVDYLIADRTLIPEASQSYYVEKIIYLPDSYQVNDARREIAGRKFTREELGLPTNGFVFCCFNNNYKIMPDIFDSWMRILRRVEGSVLWLFEGNPTVASNLRREAERAGIGADRLIFATRMTLPDHLARQRAADLFIDTFPYNAHTTASDALWAGLPVLTCAGEAFASRVAASLLTAMGIPELIVETLQQYEELAVLLAIDSDRLAHIKRMVAERRCTAPLFDTRLYAKQLETAYTMIQERYQANLPPDHIYV